MLVFPNVKLNLHRSRCKRFIKCKCGGFFVPDGRGKRRLCDACRVEHKREQNRLNQQRIYRLRQKL